MATIGGPCWSGQTKQLPLELVERIGQYLDGVSLIRMPHKMVRRRMGVGGTATTFIGGAPSIEYLHFL